MVHIGCFDYVVVVGRDDGHYGVTRDNDVYHVGLVGGHGGDDTDGEHRRT